MSVIRKLARYYRSYLGCTALVAEMKFRSKKYARAKNNENPRKNPFETYSIDIETHTITKLPSGGVNTYPMWSPNAKMMPFRRMLGETTSEVFVADDDGSNPPGISRTIQTLTAGRHLRRTEHDRIRVQPWEPESSDLYDVSGWKRRATRRGYGKTRHGSEMVARRRGDLLRHMRQVRVQRRL